MFNKESYFIDLSLEDSDKNVAIYLKATDSFITNINKLIANFLKNKNNNENIGTVIFEEKSNNDPVLTLNEINGQKISYNINKMITSENEEKSVILHEFQNVGQDNYSLQQFNYVKERYSIMGNDESYKNFKKNVDIAIEQEKSSIAKVIKNTDDVNNKTLNNQNRKRSITSASHPNMLAKTPKRSSFPLVDHVAYTILVKPLKLIDLQNRVSKDMNMSVHSDHIKRCLTDLRARCTDERYSIAKAHYENLKMNINIWPYYNSSEQQLAERMVSTFGNPKKPTTVQNQVDKEDSRVTSVRASPSLSLINQSPIISIIKNSDLENIGPDLKSNQLSQNINSKESKEQQVITKSVKDDKSTLTKIISKGELETSGLFSNYETKYPPIRCESDRTKYYISYFKGKEEYYHLKQLLIKNAYHVWLYIEEYHEMDIKDTKKEQLYNKIEEETKLITDAEIKDAVLKACHLHDELNYIYSCILNYKKNKNPQCIDSSLI